MLNAPLDSNIDKNVKFAFHISLDEPGFPPEWPVQSSMANMVVTVLSTVRRFEGIL